MCCNIFLWNICNHQSNNTSELPRRQQLGRVMGLRFKLLPRTAGFHISSLKCIHRSQCSDLLGAGRFGFKPSEGKRFSFVHTPPDLPWGPPSLLYNGGKEASVWWWPSTSELQNWGIPPTPPCACMACYGETFTLKCIHICTVHWDRQLRRNKWLPHVS